MFETQDLLDAVDAAVLQQILDRELCDRYDNEITEPEYLQGLLDEHRGAPFLAFARELSDSDLHALSDSEAITRLVQVETAIARAHALRARLVALVAAQRPAAADRPAGRPGAAGWQTRTARKTAIAPDIASGDTGSTSANGLVGSTAAAAAKDVVPEVLGVSEWLAHELQMAHPYSWTGAQDLVGTSLVLTGRLTATLGLLAAGRIDYPRARILTDLLGTCTEAVAHTVEAIVLPKAPGLTPGGLATAVRRALTKVDAAALRRRQAHAVRAADVSYWPTQDGMARLVADLPLPVAAACANAVTRYAHTQHAGGDDRPIGQIRAEMLTDLILRPWDTTRPPVTAEVTINLAIPRTGDGGGTGVDDSSAEAEVDGQTISAAQCRELLGQLSSSRLFLALHDPAGGLTAVASTAQLRRAARRTRRRARNANPAGPTNPGAVTPGDRDGPGLRPPPSTPTYPPTRAQDRHVRTRDRSCRHFGCTRKAIHADLDHHTRHPDGPTAVCNLCCYCRTHHRLKHQAPGWTRDFQADGTLTITTPTGITRTTRPPGPDTEPVWPAPAPVPPTPTTTTNAPAPAIRTNDDPPPF